jgi:hypothetical protein
MNWGVRFKFHLERGESQWRNLELRISTTTRRKQRKLLNLSRYRRERKLEIMTEGFRDFTQSIQKLLA